MLEAAEGLKKALHRMGAERDLLERTREAQEDAATEWRLRCEIAMGGIVPALAQRCKELASLKRVLWACLKKESAARLGLDSLVETLLKLETVVLADPDAGAGKKSAEPASSTTGLASGLGLLDPVIVSLLLQRGIYGDGIEQENSSATNTPPRGMRHRSRRAGARQPSLKSVALCVLAAVRLQRGSLASARSSGSDDEAAGFCYYLVPGVGRVRIDIPVVSGGNLPGDDDGSSSGVGVGGSAAAPLVTSKRTHAALTRLMASITTGGNLVPAASSPFETKQNVSKEGDNRPQTFVSKASSVLPPLSNETHPVRSTATVGVAPPPSLRQTLPASTAGATTGDILETLVMSNAETSRLWRNRYTTPYQSVLVQSALKKLASHLRDALTRAAKSEATVRVAVDDARAAREIASEAQAARIRAQRRSTALEDRLRSYVEAQCNMNGVVAPKQEEAEGGGLERAGLEVNDVGSAGAGAVEGKDTASLASSPSPLPSNDSLTVSSVNAHASLNAPPFVRVSAALFDGLRRERDALKESCELLSKKSREDGERWRAVEAVLTDRLSGITAEATTLKSQLGALKADYAKSMKALKLERKGSTRKLKQASETMASLEQQLAAGVERASELVTARELVAQELARARVEQRKSFAEWKDRQSDMQRRHDIEMAARSRRQQALETEIAAAEEKVEWAGRAVAAKERLWEQERTGMLQQIERGRFRERLLAESDSRGGEGRGRSEEEEEEEKKEEEGSEEEEEEADMVEGRGMSGFGQFAKSTAKVLMKKKKKKTKAEAKAKARKKKSNVSSKGKSTGKSNSRSKKSSDSSTSTRMGTRMSASANKKKLLLKSAKKGKGKRSRNPSLQAAPMRLPPPGEAVEEELFGAESAGKRHSSDEEDEAEHEAEAQRGLVEMKQYIDRIDRRLYNKYGTPPRKASPVQSPWGGQSAAVPEEEELLIPRMGPKK